MNADQITEMYPEITRYILEHFTLFWSIIVGVFGIISIALYFIWEKSVRRGVNKAVDAIKKSIQRTDKKIQQTENRLQRMEIFKEQNHPMPHNLSLMGSVKPIPRFSCEYSRDASDLVLLQIAVQAADGFLPSGMHMFAMLPEGFRPIQNVGLTLSAFLEIEVHSDGAIYYTSTEPLKRLLVSSISFYAQTPCCP